MKSSTKAEILRRLDKSLRESSSLRASVEMYQCWMKALREPMRKLMATRAWTPMSEREPDRGVDVLACSPTGECRVVEWTGDAWQSDGESEDSWAYSHWMPLPERHI